MMNIPDAPWIRDAEINGYPVGRDTGDPSIGDCPMMFAWDEYEDEN